MSIKSKLICIGILSTLSICIITGLAQYNITMLVNTLNTFMLKTNELQKLFQLSTSFSTISENFKDSNIRVMMGEEPSDTAESITKKIDELMKTLSDMGTGKSSQKKYHNLSVLLTKLKKPLQKGFSRIEESDSYGASEIYMASLRTSVNEFQKEVNDQVLSAKDLLNANFLEAKKRYRFNMIVLISCVLITILLTVLTVFFIIRNISLPLDKAVTIADKLAGGDLSLKIEGQRQDETGRLLSAMKHMVREFSGMISMVKSVAGQIESSASEMSYLSSQMSNGANMVSQKSNTVASSTEDMNSNMRSVAAAMEQAATNLSTVAASAEEMTSTINEIANNSERASIISGEAVSKAEIATESINELGNKAREIDKVTETITDISDQTNLLALNATIEAARAGEAGKGFAVVANEIKELASQTTAATKEIKNKIESIQSTTETTVTKIIKIKEVIKDANEIVSSIATAVEEQSATTKEIAENITQASLGSDEVNENVAQSTKVSGEIAKDIDEVNHSTSDIAESSSRVHLSAEKLSKLAGQLNEMVGKFKM